MARKIFHIEFDDGVMDVPYNKVQKIEFFKDFGVFYSGGAIGLRF